jgi:hypothetical protein
MALRLPALRANHALTLQEDFWSSPGLKCGWKSRVIWKNRMTPDDESATFRLVALRFDQLRDRAHSLTGTAETPFPKGVLWDYQTADAVRKLGPPCFEHYHLLKKRLRYANKNDNNNNNSDSNITNEWIHPSGWNDMSAVRTYEMGYKRWWHLWDGRGNENG